MKIVKENPTESRVGDGAPRPASTDVVSTLGHSMLITGNIVCAGAVQIYGRVVGDIHAAQLTICEGAKVEGKVIAQETTIQGAFKGTIHGNSVKLQSSAVVEGEIYNRSLTIELNAQFEGVARRLDKPVEPPTAAQASGENLAPAGAPAMAPQDTPVAEPVN